MLRKIGIGALIAAGVIGGIYACLIALLAAAIIAGSHGP